MGSMNTFTGKRIDPLEMRAEDVCLEDLAHALSLLCRGGGHLRHFYSVGQHAINCMKEARARGWPPRLQLACLLHDAGEAYLADVIRPVKVHLSNYSAIEEAVMRRIGERYGLMDLSAEENRRWRQIDDEMLCAECAALLAGAGDGRAPQLSARPDLTERRWESVEKEFKELACLLTAELGTAGA